MAEGISPSVGSSSIKTDGFTQSARAIDSMVCSPPDSVPERCFIRSRSTGKSPSAYSSDSCPEWRVISPISRFSATVSSENSRRPCGT